MSYPFLVMNSFLKTFPYELLSFMLVIFLQAIQIILAFTLLWVDFCARGDTPLISTIRADVLTN
jgi:hypothetical protein